MAEHIESGSGVNNFEENHSIQQETIPSRDGINAIKSSNRLMQNSFLTNSTRQEVFSVEISKVQDLMLEQEHTYKVEIEELEGKLSQIEEENTILESQITEFESKECDESEKLYEEQMKENEHLTKELSSTAEKIKQIRTILNEYYRTVARFNGQYEAEVLQLEEQKKVLNVEIDFALRLVDTMEAEFNNIHQRYEKCKSVIEHLKENDRKLSDLSTNGLEKTKILNFDLCQKLKEYIKENLEVCNRDIHTTVKASKTDLAKMQAILQRANLKVESQNEALIQINDEIKETTAMCDRFIGRFNK